MKFSVKSIALSGVAIGMFVSAAHAADISPAAANWTGFYLGVGGGGNFAFSDTGASGFGALIVDDYSCPDADDDDDCDVDFVSDNGTTFGSANWPDEIGIENDYGAASFARIGSGSPNDLIEALEGAPVPSNIEDILDFITSNLGDDENDTGAAGAFGLGQIGFDYQLGDRFVIGVDATYRLGSVDVSQDATSLNGSILSDITNADDDDDDDLAYSYGGQTLSTDLSLDNSWSVGGRMGVLFNEHNLLFVSGGYASAKAKLEAGFGPGGSVTGDEWDEAGVTWDVSSSSSEWLSGYYVGGGLESMLTENVSLRMEYRYTDLGSIETSTVYGDGDVDQNTSSSWGAITGVSAEASPVVHAVSATVNWRF